MHKEVTRSLILWPAAASATIILMGWLASPDSPDVPWLSAGIDALAEQPRGRSWPEPTPLAKLDDSIDLPRQEPLPEIEVSTLERVDPGCRTMQLPKRLADAHPQSDKPALKAPVRNEQYETAGMILQPPQYAETSVGELSGELLSGDVLAANRIAAAASLPIDEALGYGTLQSVPPALTEPPPLVGPPRPDEAFAMQKDAEPTSLLPKSIAILGDLESHRQVQPQQIASAPAVKPAVIPEPTVESPQSSAPVRRKVDANPTAWPVTRQLDLQLQSLADLASGEGARTADSRGMRGTGQLVSSSPLQAPAASWAADVESRLAQLRKLPRIGHPHAGELIGELSDLAAAGLQQAEQVGDRQQQIEWLCAAHAILRRAAVWSPIWQVASAADPKWMVSDQQHLPGQPMAGVLQNVRRDLRETGDEIGWGRYLLLEEIDQLADSDQFKQRQIVAQRLLSRLNWHGLDAEHARWLSRTSVVELAESVRPWARSAVDYAKLMQQLERRESDAIDLAAIDIAGVAQTLRFAENPQAVRVADALDTFYRNANVRMAISQTMLQRMLPTIDRQTLPVRTQIFGSKVRGRSEIESDLFLKLHPSADRWSMQLRTEGDVHTKSTGFNGPIAIRTAGDSSFAAATPIEVTPKGLRVGRSDVQVHGSTRLRGIRTDYDGWPLIGSLVQSFAASRYDSVSHQSNRIANRRIRSQVGGEIDSQLDNRVGQATEKLSQMVLGPLGKLQLDPKVTDMQTTDSRLLARYRLAGDWQLAAFTPRPRAPQSSLMSLQVHQSAINNTLEQLVPKDKPKLIQEIVSDGLVMFGQTDAALSDDFPDDVTVQFARTRPITIEVEQGQLWVTLRVMRLTRGERLDLRRFIVRAQYRPQYDGLHAMLVREGHLQISGPRMSMRQRLPLRAIFNKVLSPNRPFHLTLPQLTQHPAAEGLAVSQLEMRDGWIAMAISEATAPRIALRPRE